MLLIEPQDADHGHCDADREANQVLHGGSPSSPGVALGAVAERSVNVLPDLLALSAPTSCSTRFPFSREHFKLLIHFAFLSVKL